LLIFLLTFLLLLGLSCEHKAFVTTLGQPRRRTQGKTSLRPYFLLKLQCFQVIQFSATADGDCELAIQGIGGRGDRALWTHTSTTVCVCVCLAHLHSSSVNFFTFFASTSTYKEFGIRRIAFAVSCAHPNPFPWPTAWPIICRLYSNLIYKKLSPDLSH